MAKIGIIGTRGVPNHYGGFEKFAQILSQKLVSWGEEVWVYNSHDHPYQHKTWQGVNILHCYDPEDKTGTIGQFLYDFLCILDSRKRNFDIILQLGYTSNSIWNRLLPKESIIITNMDGLEWKRTKYSKPVRHFLKYAETLAVKSSHHLVADSPGIQKYLAEEYDTGSTFISYGAQIVDYAPLPEEFGIEAAKYFLLIARMQADNHVEEIIKGVLASESQFPLLVVGHTNNSYGRNLKKKYGNSPQILFTGGIFNEKIINGLRYHTACHFHGHSAGGTNPSLLEAMAASSVICAHDNLFNRAVLQQEALFFKTSCDITKIINDEAWKDGGTLWVEKNLEKIKNDHDWETISKSYHRLFLNLLNKKDHNKSSENS